MAYLIKIHSHSNPDLISLHLVERAAKAGFRMLSSPIINRQPIQTRGPFSGSRKLPYATLTLGKVRLSQKKPYCGNHPGPCIVGAFGGVRKKINATYLEWEDWVRFHDQVNDLLDYYMVDADVSTKPQDARGIMWIRKGFHRRYRWDYTEKNWDQPGIFGARPVLVWNLGTDDQFKPQVSSASQ